MKRVLLAVAVVVLVAAGVASAYGRLRMIWLTPGHCVTVSNTRVCARAAKAKPKTTKAKTSAHILFQHSGSGIYTGPSFKITGSEIAVRYSYNCSNFGTGNFILDIKTAGYGDDMSLANDLGSGATNKLVYGYPQSPGSYYHVEINSECAWAVVVAG